MRLHSVLKNYAELYPRLFCYFDQGVSTLGADVNRLFRQKVQTVFGSGDALVGVET